MSGTTERKFPSGLLYAAEEERLLPQNGLFDLGEGWFDILKSLPHGGSPVSRVHFLVHLFAKGVIFEVTANLTTTSFAGGTLGLKNTIQTGWSFITGRMSGISFYFLGDGVDRNQFVASRAFVEVFSRLILKLIFGEGAGGNFTLLFLGARLG
jgi:hypothetical protein